MIANKFFSTWHVRTVLKRSKKVWSCVICNTHQSKAISRSRSLPTLMSDIFSCGEKLHRSTHSPTFQRLHHCICRTVVACSWGDVHGLLAHLCSMPAGLRPLKGMRHFFRFVFRFFWEIQTTFSISPSWLWLRQSKTLKDNSLFPAHQSQTKYFSQTFRQICLWPHQLQKSVTKTNWNELKKRIKDALLMTNEIGQLMMTQSVETSSQNRLLSSTKHPRVSYSVSFRFVAKAISTLDEKWRFYVV